MTDEKTVLELTPPRAASANDGRDLIAGLYAAAAQLDDGTSRAVVLDAALVLDRVLNDLAAAEQRLGSAVVEYGLKNVVTGRITASTTVSGLNEVPGVLTHVERLAAVGEWKPVDLAAHGIRPRHTAA